MTIVIKELVIAGRYGRRDEVDAFLIAFLVPFFVATLLGNAMSTAAIPVYLRYKAKEGMEAARHFFMGMNGLLLVASAVLALLIRVAAPYFLPAIASAFSGPKTALSYGLLQVMIPYIFLSGIVAFWSAVLNAEERFAVVVLVPMISPLAITACLLFFPLQRISVVAYGTLLGIFGETVVLGVALRRKGFSLWPRWEGWSAPVRAFIRQFLPSVAGGILMGSTLLVDQAMAAMLPAGSVAALSYGNKVIGFLLSILTTTLATLLTPYFSKRLDGTAPDRVWKGLGQLLLVIIPSAVLLSLVVSVFALPLVRVIFYRGVFTSEDVRVVAGVQSWLALQMPFYIGSVVLVRFIAALQKNWIIPYVAVCNVVLNITLNFLLMKRMGVEGIALSTSLVHLFSFVVLLLFIYFSKNSRS
jgi:putative peptidoglycan lipid II flippase